MFLGIPGVTNVASGMTEDGKKFSYTVFESIKELAVAKDQINGRLKDIDSTGSLLEGDQVVHAIDDVR